MVLGTTIASLKGILSYREPGLGAMVAWSKKDAVYEHGDRRDRWREVIARAHDGNGVDLIAFFSRLTQEAVRMNEVLISVSWCLIDAMLVVNACVEHLSLNVEVQGTSNGWRGTNDVVIRLVYLPLSVSREMVNSLPNHHEASYVRALWSSVITAIVKSAKKTS